MKRDFLLSSLVYILVLMALATTNGHLLVLTLPFVIFLGSGLMFEPESITLKVNRSISKDHVSPGTTVQITLLIKNEGDRLETVVLMDQLPNGLDVVRGESSVITSLDAGQAIEYSYSVRASRGDYRFDRFLISVGDVLGIRHKEIVIPLENRILVHPEAKALSRIPIRPRGTKVFSGFIPAREGGPGVEFYRVREYHHGDPLRWINWRASARYRQNLFINEFEQERCADVNIILDTRRRSEIQSDFGDSLFEHSVGAAAAIAETFLKDGNRVGLLMFGTQLDWTIPGYGKIQKEQIFRNLARAKPGESLIFEKLENIPVGLLPAYSQLVLISPLHRDDISTLIHLRARGYALLVISPDPISFEMKRLRRPDNTMIFASRIAQIERRLIILKLKQAGIQVLSWDVDTSLDGTIHVALSRVVPQIHATGVGI
jgi:uncharacterized protein (DUF58 family)